MDEKPLPKPPKTPFGRQRREEQQEAPGTLFADRIAAAKMEGRVEEFLQAELPDNEQMRRLVSLMMGMTGMGPLEDVPGKAEEKTAGEGEPDRPDQVQATNEVPEDVRNAIQSGDVQGLMGMLRREYEKRTGSAPAEGPASDASHPGSPDTSEKEVLDRLISISSMNSLSIDWLIMRALKLYISEYEKTGRL